MKNGKCFEDESTTIGNYSSMSSLVYKYRMTWLSHLTTSVLLKTYFVT